MNPEKKLKYGTRIPVPVKRLNLNQKEKEASVCSDSAPKKNSQIRSTKDFKTKEPFVQQIRNGPRLVKKVLENKEIKSVTPRSKNCVLEGSENKLRAKHDSEICAKMDDMCLKVPVVSQGEKENKLPVPEHIASQKEIKFEANEKFRRMLLSEKPFSPHILNHRKISSSCERPSRYGPVLSDNPLRDLLDACSSIKRTRQTSSMRKITIEKPIQQTPMRDSFYYTPGINPKDELLKSLKQLKERKTLTASRVKKVTFNMNVEKFSPLETPEDNDENPLANAPENLPIPQLEMRSETGEKEFSPKQSDTTSKNDNSPLKICTPRAISMLPDLNAANFSSPELPLCIDRKLLKETAPISTPLVLKSLASSIFSPEAELPSIRLKLEFADEGKDSPRKTVLSSPSRNIGPSLLDKIETNLKKQDDQADMECHLNLLNECSPVICGRYLRNPVAVILTEGDDMHFLPIKF